jgi:hypothetical protein
LSTLFWYIFVSIFGLEITHGHSFFSVSHGFSPSVPRQETGRPFVDRIQLLDFTSTKKSDGSIY